MKTVIDSEMSPPSDGTSNNQPPSKKKKLGRTSVHDEFTRGRGMGKGGVEKDGCYCNVCGEFFMNRNPTQQPLKITL